MSRYSTSKLERALSIAVAVQVIAAAIFYGLLLSGRC